MDELRCRWCQKLKYLKLFGYDDYDAFKIPAREGNKGPKGVLS